MARFEAASLSEFTVTQFARIEATTWAELTNTPLARIALRRLAEFTETQLARFAVTLLAGPPILEASHWMEPDLHEKRPQTSP